MKLIHKCAASDADKHQGDIYCLIFHDGKLYSSGEDGKVKIWNTELQLIKEVQAHESVVYYLAIIQHMLYTCSNDGIVKIWHLENLTLMKELCKDEIEYWRLYVNEDCLYVLDQYGNITVWKDNVKTMTIQLLDDIKEFVIKDGFIYSVRDRDMLVNELTSGKGRYVTRCCTEGCSPLILTPEDKLCFASRTGKEINIHENNKKSLFKRLGQIQAHEMIITCLANRNEILASGAWDCKLKLWNINSLEMLGEYTFDKYVSLICFGSIQEIYAATAQGNITKLSIE